MSVDPYINNRRFADDSMQQVFDILRRHMGRLVIIRSSSYEQDTKHATDAIITLDVGTIAVRVRREDCVARDFTIRSHTRYGGETELDKIDRGDVKYYFYGWKKDGRIDEWVILDVFKMIESKTFDFMRNRPDISNKDGTTFKAMHYYMMPESCIVVHNLSMLIRPAELSK